MRLLTISWTSIVAVVLALTSWEANAGDQWRPPIQSGQGTELHGTGEFENANIPLIQGGLTFTFDGGNFQPPAGSSLNGQIFTGQQPDGGTVTFVIQAVVSHKSILSQDGGTPDVLVPPPNFEFAVKTIDGRSVCADRENALAVPYAWKATGELEAVSGPPYSFTFACVPHRDAQGELVGGGAIAKCVDWGYPPWATGRSFIVSPRIDTTLSTYDDLVAKRFHQTCVAMATADYCGEGVSNTVSNTPIGIADIENVVNPDAGLAAIDEASGWAVLNTAPSSQTFSISAFPQTSPFDDPATAPALEAIWGFDSCDGGIFAQNGDDKCGRARILCVSRARWATLSLAATCLSGEKAGPILNPDFPNSCLGEKCAKLCDDWKLSDLRAKNATLFSYSASWDKALVSFIDTGGQWITTTNVDRSYPVSLGPPLNDSAGFTLRPGLAGDGSFHEVRYEGKLFRDSIPETVQTGLGRLVSLYRCTSNGEYLTTTGDAGSSACAAHPGYSPDGTGEAAVEGLIYAPDHPEAAKHDPLFLWLRRDAAGEHFVTSRIQPAEYEMVGTGPLGYLPGRRQPPPATAGPCGCSEPGGGILPLGLVLASLLVARSRRV